MEHRNVFNADAGSILVMCDAVHPRSRNNYGAVVFDATLTDNTQEIYLRRHGVLSLVVKTGSDTGIISSFDGFGGGVANTQISANDAGKVLFAARFERGGGALLIASPR